MRIGLISCGIMLHAYAHAAVGSGACQSGIGWRTCIACRRRPHWCAVMHMHGRFLHVQGCPAFMPDRVRGTLVGGRS